MKRAMPIARYSAAAFCGLLFALSGAPVLADTAAQKKAWAAYIARQSPDEQRELRYCLQHPEKPSSTDYDEAEQAVEIVIKQSARDPSSIVFDPYQYPALDHGSCGKILYVCGEVNGKNAFGAYTGLQRYVFTVSGPKKGQFKLGIGRGEEQQRCGRIAD